MNFQHFYYKINSVYKEAGCAGVAVDVALLKVSESARDNETFKVPGIGVQDIMFLSFVPMIYYL